VGGADTGADPWGGGDEIELEHDGSSVRERFCELPET
jgi:hypothetical protein